jgi:hypothetical protein
LRYSDPKRLGGLEVDDKLDLHGAARARGHNGGRKPKMTPAKLRLAQAAMGKRGTIVAHLCNELGVSSQTLYRHVSPAGALRADGRKLISKTNPQR